MHFIIKDEDGKEFEVEEIKEQDEAAPAEAPKAEEKPAEDVHDDALSSDEITALKELAAMAPALKKLLEVENQEHAADSAEEPTTPEEPADEHKPEEVVDTCNDSVSTAAGSIEQPAEIKDSVSAIDAEMEINDAWQKRYSRKEDAK